MKVVIRYDDGRYFFTRRDFLGDNVEIEPEAIFEVDEQTYECWRAIDDLAGVLQKQLKAKVNAGG